MKNRDHDVFISYSSKNKNIADAIVADLEQNNIKCWYAPRDIYPGEDWAGAIKNAIGSTKIFVLVFTDESNRSHQVTNEVTLAVNGGKIIIPFRLSGSDMNDTLQYYLSSVHWLDAVSQPLNQNIETLRKQISALLDIEESADKKAAAMPAGIAGAAAGTAGATVAAGAVAGTKGSGISGGVQPSGQTGSSGGSSVKTGIVIGFLVAALAIGIGAFALSRGGNQSKDSEPKANATEEVKQEEEKKAEDPAAGEQAAEAEAAAQETAADAAEPAPAEQEAVAEAAEPASEAADQPASEPEPAAKEEPLVMIPENALSYNGHHYYIYNDVKSNWETAASNCRDRGGYMAVINDEEENETLYKYMTAMGYDQAFFGLIYSNTNDDWVYLDGDTSDFRDWGYNSEGVAEPNNAEGWEYHVEFDANMQDGHWNDAKFGTKTYTPDGDAYKNLYTYICEWDR
ncbi:MAG: TIR domain-containing protein [Lachnospiraceae bacterium]|nr:TIR domain-containing protein [Lachnospiraceae bacterium]